MLYDEERNRCPGHCRYRDPPFGPIWLWLGSRADSKEKEPYQGLWALPGGHLTPEDASLEAAAQREAQEETGLAIPLDMFQQVHTFEDFEDPRGKYVCLLYVLSKPLGKEACIEAGDDASHVQWFPVDDLQALPYLAFHHIRLLRMALRQMFTSSYHHALGMQPVDVCQCEIKKDTGVGCPNTAYWRYEGIALCPHHMQTFAARTESACIDVPSPSNGCARH